MRLTVTYESFFPSTLSILETTLFVVVAFKDWSRLYSLTSPYGHLCITDSSFGPRNAKNHTFPTSVIQTPL